MNTAVSFIIGFIGIGFMVLVHETGHFFAAKIMNIEVEVFAIGWGKALIRWLLPTERKQRSRTGNCIQR